MRIVEASPDWIREAGRLLRFGKLVVLPTETVYGLAADATRPDAVAKVYSAKGRPAENPMIVHVAELEDARNLASEWPDAAEALARRFWPGPLTLVVRSSGRIPAIVAGGLQTVALRIPEHPVAREAIREAGVPLAMPSANRFMELSPTRVGHLHPEVLAAVDLVLDAGSCQVGVESTVVDVSDAPPRILRPGGVNRAEIEAALKEPLGSKPGQGRLSPGMYSRHYAPRAKVVLTERVPSGEAGLTFGEAGPAQIRMPRDPSAYAARLYDSLHRLDERNPNRILIEAPPDDPAWETVWDRIRKAAGETQPDGPT